MKKLLLITLVTLSTITLYGCSKPTNSNEQSTTKDDSAAEKQANIQLLNDISGVWSDGSSIITLYNDHGRFQFVIDDTPILANIGDIDVANNTVNLLVTKKADGEQGIITVRKIPNPSDTTYTIAVTFFDGSRSSLNFIRNVGNDDKNRLLSVFAKHQREADELAHQQALENASQQAKEIEESANQQAQQQTPLQDASQQAIETPVPVAQASNVEEQTAVAPQETLQTTVTTTEN